MPSYVASGRCSLLAAAWLISASCATGVPGFLGPAEAATEARQAASEALEPLAAVAKALMDAEGGAEGNRTAVESMQRMAVRELAGMMQVLPAVAAAVSGMLGENMTAGQLAHALATLNSVANKTRAALKSSIPRIANATFEYVESVNPAAFEAHGAPGDFSDETDFGSMMEGVQELAEMLAAMAECTSGDDCKSTVHLSCMIDISAVLEDVEQVVSDVVESVPVDCRGAQVSQLDCGADLAHGLQKVASISNQLAAAAFHCGRVNEACVELTAKSFSWLASTIDKGISAAVTCRLPADSPASLLCTADALQAVGGVANAASDAQGIAAVCHSALPEEAAEDLDLLMGRLRATLERLAPGFVRPASSPSASRRLRGGGAAAQ